MSGNRLLKFLPLIVYIGLLIGAQLSGNVHLFIQDQLSNVLVLQYPIEELAGYYLCVFFVCLYPLVPKNDLAYWFYITLSLFILSQLEYKLFVWVSSFVSDQLVGKINLLLSAVFISLFSVSFTLFDLERRMMFTLNLAVIVCSMVAAYHSYNIWASWNRNSDVF